MEFFHNAKAVRLQSNHGKYLHADEDEESVNQDRDGSSKNSRWTVEFVPGSDNAVRLKGCYGKYLTASTMPFLLGMTGRKILQTLPPRLDDSVEWEPIKDGSHAKLRTRYGQFLRANGGLPPWRNSVTHDIPFRSSTQDWVLWDVHVMETLVVKVAAKPRPQTSRLNGRKDAKGGEKWNSMTEEEKKTYRENKHAELNAKYEKSPASANNAENAYEVEEHVGGEEEKEEGEAEEELEDEEDVEEHVDEEEDKEEGEAEEELEDDD